MRVFKTECKDNKTGYSMILSECSYNMAMDWLEKELAKKDYGVSATYTMENGLIAIFTGVGMCSGRTFYYDEERGYLLGE